MSQFGCFYAHLEGNYYLPQVGLDVHATILSTTCRTKLIQNFTNPSSQSTPEVFYSFPLYERVSIVGFTCTVDGKAITGQVKPKAKAEEEYQQAKSAGLQAAIFDHSTDCRDVFRTRVGNVPGGSDVLINITLVEELDYDAETEGPRYTMPVTIAPRYGYGPLIGTQSNVSLYQTSIKVDISMEKGSKIQNVRSPSHAIQVDIGRTSMMSESTFEAYYASVKLREGIQIKEDFVLTIRTTEKNSPFAMLETHPSLPNQRALMVSLIPKFSLPPDRSEIVFVLDQSGSMTDKIPTLRSALGVLLKSLSPGILFNIVSFGSPYRFLWSRSRPYDESSLEHALHFSQGLQADMGGTEILSALQAAVEIPSKDRFLEVLLLTDGQVWNQEAVFQIVRKASQNASSRFFTLGIGNEVSHSAINGISKAGNGFSQSVLNYEMLNKKVIRMLKGALTPRLRNCALKLHSSSSGREEFDHLSSTELSYGSDDGSTKPLMSLYDENVKEPSIKNMHEDLPNIPIPHQIQEPTEISSIFPFLRKTVDLLLSHDDDSIPQKVTLEAMSNQGPLSLYIPVQNVGKGETIHQLAAKEAMVDLEEGHGWIHSDPKAKLITEKFKHRLESIMAKECERLGVGFKYQGFIAHS